MTFNHGVPGSNPGWVTKKYADVAKLADALDLGSSGRPWGFKSLHPHQNEGVSPSGKAQDFDSCTRRFKSCHPCHTFSPKWDYFLYYKSTNNLCLTIFMQCNKLITYCGGIAKR